MGKEYSARSFKSGNSVAIRMPAGLGISPDQEWTVIEDKGELVLRRKDAPKPRFNVDKIWGCARDSGLRFVENREFEPRPSDRDL